MIGKLFGAWLGEKVAGKNERAKGAILGYGAASLAKRSVPTLAALLLGGWAYSLELQRQAQFGGDLDQLIHPLPIGRSRPGDDRPLAQGLRLVGHDPIELPEHKPLVDKRPLVTKKDVARSDCDDVVVENARVDRRG